MARDKMLECGMAAAAELLQRELHRYETLARELDRERLDSEKALRRAAQALASLRESEERLREHLTQLVEAISDARERQQAQAAGVAARAEEVGHRTETLTALLARWSAIGTEAAAVTRLIQRVNEAEGNGSSAGDLDATFAEVDDRLSKLAEDAAELSRTALAQTFNDLAKQADGLRQQVLGSLNKVRLARKPR